MDPIDACSLLDTPNVAVPNFNDAALSLVIFHVGQSIPLLRYDFKEGTGYSFDQGLLSGMISAILTVSEEIDVQHKSILRLIDQTSYKIIVTMGRKTGALLFARPEENEQILRDFSNYVLAEFEARYDEMLSSDMNFEENMFDDFLPVIKKTATIPIALSEDILMDVMAAIKSHASSFNVMVCDKLVFLPVFKQLSDYITPNELNHVRTFLRDVIIGSTGFLDRMSKFGSMDTIVLRTSKKKFFIANLDPFYLIIFAKKDAPDPSINDLLVSLQDIVYKNSLVLTTRQKAWLVEVLEHGIKALPGASVATLKDQFLVAMKQFQRERKVLIRAIDQYTVQERRATYAALITFLVARIRQYYHDVEGMASSIDDLGRRMEDLVARVLA